ncbi:YheC/YheD family endospore coat-associated protein [Paenibacillus senegalensis]|uniref:YheC/YheD family endospore coat-associated protein n=1 Tax=Paenibacillus senegalensis TaxID=1465766 RepID=UPI000287A57A|nr:YheC/YheD family protein [Paenibacillus senegalensis]
MAKAKLTIRLQTSSSLDSQTILLKESIMKQWKLAANQTVTLQFGSLRKEVTLVPIAKSTTLRVHPHLASEMNLYEGAKLNGRYSAETRTFHLGPLIAVMVSRVHSKSSDRPFGANTSFCRELTLACEKFGGLVYFFSPAELPAESGRLSGWIYDKGWKKRSFPIPNVVYNRLTKRRLENSDRVQQFIHEVKSTYRSHVFNEKFLNKTEVFQILKQVPGVQSYLPESYAYKSSTLQAMCARHSTVYLKPVTGSLGKGIIRISKAPKGYLCHFNQSSGVRKLSFASLKAMTQAIGSRIKSRYQIQQGIRLIQSNGNPIDFRVLAQKNNKGVWAITSTVGRIAGSHTFVSNLARGGTLTSVSTALARGGFGAAQRSAIYHRLQKAALSLAAGLDEKIPEHFAELGIDLAVDTSGKVWLLEINSKPSKEENSSLAPNKIRPSVRRIVHYCQHLAKL